jgi:hypothetical protein
MAGETTTPNIGLQVPAFNQPNWQVPINFDLNQLDLIFGGTVQVPALNVISLTVSSVGALLAAGFIPEVPAGAVPGTLYTTTFLPGLFLALFLNGIFQLPGTSYSIVGQNITMVNATIAGDVLYVLYFK